MRFTAFEAFASEAGMTFDVQAETQNSDYEAGVAHIDGEAWHIRTARNTPTKPGAFVAFWTRDADGRTMPFGADDLAEGLFVFVEQQDRRGAFRFSAAQLDDLGIATGRTKGKTGFRVYPTWCADLNPQATATQRAQASAFTEY